MMAAAANQVGKVPMRCDGGEGRPRRLAAATEGGAAAAAMEERCRPRIRAAEMEEMGRPRRQAAATEGGAAAAGGCNGGHEAIALGRRP
jgi:hypothetical protein